MQARLAPAGLLHSPQVNKSLAVSLLPSVPWRGNKLTVPTGVGRVACGLRRQNYCQREQIVMKAACFCLLLTVWTTGISSGQLPHHSFPIRRLVLNESAADRNDAAEDWSVAGVSRSWEFVVIHHSATTSGSVESIHREHRRRLGRDGQPWLGIGYHFVIGNGTDMRDGEISPTFRWRDQIHGAHSGSIRHNDRGIGICLIGDFEKSEPSTAQQQAVIRLIAWLVYRYDIPDSRVIGHRHVRATSCPGRHFPLPRIIHQSFQSSATAETTRRAP